MDDPPKTRGFPRDRVFGFVSKDGSLLYDTLKSNPEKSKRAFRRTGIPRSSVTFMEFIMKRRRAPGDVRGLTPEVLRKNEPYVGPMR